MSASPFLASRAVARRRRLVPQRLRSPEREHDALSVAEEEQRRAQNYPISRWCWRPLAGRLARWLAQYDVAPLALTLANLTFGLLGCATLVVAPWAGILAAGFFLLAWICDRTDGQLARLQAAASRSGAWLDANVDEAIDVGGKAASAFAASTLLSSHLPWLALSLFVAGKYLLMHGLLTWETATDSPTSPRTQRMRSSRPARSTIWGRLAAARRWPGNADVRLHLFLATLGLAAWFPAAIVCETALLGAYYLTWALARLAIVPLRAAGAAHG
ncbi:MAG TPA: CDP-alcohol phosphatidyltransferase family protein [Pirellulales bacterium]